MKWRSACITGGTAVSKRYGLKFVQILTGMTREERLRALVRVLRVIRDRKLEYRNGKLVARTG